MPLENLAYFGKNGMLLIGESGLGKSTAYRSVLVASGYTPLSPDQTPESKQYFYQITAQNRDVADPILEKGLRYGIPVIIDEFNLISSVDFGSYLDGRFPENSEYYGEAPASGFVLLLTGNPPERYKGRTPVTPKLIDQTVTMSWTLPYTQLDFNQIVSDALPNTAEDNTLSSMISQYLLSASRGIQVNARPIFEKLNQLRRGVQLS